jgi:hypothetical protein
LRPRPFLRALSRRAARPSIRAFRNSTREVPMYRVFGYAHATLHRALRSVRDTAGQGTVEYVALILLVALVMAGVVAAMKGFKTDEGQALGDAILAKIKQAVRKVQF